MPAGSSTRGSGGIGKERRNRKGGQPSRCEVGSVGSGFIWLGERAGGDIESKVDTMDSLKDFHPLRGVFHTVSAGDEVVNVGTGRAG